MGLDYEVLEELCMIMLYFDKWFGFATDHCIILSKLLIVNYVGFYWETKMAAQLFGDYPGAM